MEHNWPYLYVLSDGYKVSYPTFEQAMTSMLYEMQSQQQLMGVIYLCCDSGTHSKEMIVATVTISPVLADHVIPLGADNLADLMTDCQNMAGSA